MASFDWEEIQKAKELHRARLATLPPDERVRVIERLHAQGLKMRGARVTRVPESSAAVSAVVSAVVSAAVSAAVSAPASTQTGAAVMQLVVLGANPGFATAVTERINSTGAVKNTIPPL